MVNGSYKCLNPQIRGVKRQVVFAIKSTKTITILMLMTFCYFKNSIIRVFQSYYLSLCWLYIFISLNVLRGNFSITFKKYGCNKSYSLFPRSSLLTHTKTNIPYSDHVFVPVFAVKANARVLSDQSCKKQDISVFKISLLYFLLASAKYTTTFSSYY